MAPVITEVTYSPTFGWRRVGSIITATIVSDGTGYTLGTSTINGVAVADFTDLANNTYTVTYTVVEGNTDRLTTIPLSIILDDGAPSAAYVTSPVEGDCPEIDANSPTISNVTYSPTSGWVIVGEVITATITGAEQGLVLGTSTINGTAVAGFVDNANNTYTVTYTVVEGDTDRATTIPLSIILEDPAGNESVAYTTVPDAADSPEIDANSPTCVITENAPSDPASSDTFVATFTFGEEMTGFVIGDIIQVNCVASDFATADNIVFTATITPTASGTLTLRVPAASGLGDNGNPNLISNLMSLEIDATGADTIAIPTALTSLVGKTLSVQSYLTSKVKDVPVTVTYSADQNYVTTGNTCDLSLGSRIRNIIDVMVISNTKGLKIDYVAGSTSSNGKLLCRGVDPAAGGGAVVGFPELASASNTTNSMVVRLLVRGY